MASSWADQVEAGDEGPEPLPPSTTTRNNNIKTVIDYRREENGKVTKVIHTYKIEKRRVPRIVAVRKHWKKFGTASRDNPGPNPSTTLIADDVYLTLTTNREQLEKPEENPLAKLSNQRVTCRICKGDHWTTKCPYKDTLGDAPVTNEDSQADAAPSAGGGGGGGAGGKYIPPSQRGDRAVAGATMGRGRDDNGAGVRVSNLSEETTEQDLQELFKPFGRISRIYLAKDKNTQQSKGFAFVTYYDKDDASRAIRSLHGFGYDHLILNLEWAK